MISIEVINLLKEKINKLEKKDIDLIVSDFDDTIFSRKEQLKNPIIKKNRGNKGNFVMRKIIGIDNMMKKYYLEKDFPKIITNKLRKNHDLILTAGYYDFQKAKIEACELDHINYRIVPGGEEKILETIDYIINKLKFIPNKITVYEDRPQYFVENRNFLKNLLKTEFEIILVEMIDNNQNPKIEKIETF